MLSILAVRFVDDPSKKVKKIIPNLIYRAMEEANAEDSQKCRCDVKLSNEFTEENIDILVNKIQENQKDAQAPTP